jgi:hypothetical protein
VSWDENHWNGQLDQVPWLVKRDRNHPSVVIWSICNEVGARVLVSLLFRSCFALVALVLLILSFAQSPHVVSLIVSPIHFRIVFFRSTRHFTSHHAASRRVTSRHITSLRFAYLLVSVCSALIVVSLSCISWLTFRARFPQVLCNSNGGVADAVAMKELMHKLDPLGNRCVTSPYAYVQPDCSLKVQVS